MTEPGAGFYQADCRFLEDGGERNYAIIYAAGNYAHAISSAFAWTRGRRRDVPEFFGTLLAVTVYQLRPQFIDPDTGAIVPATSSPLYEWKCDWGIPEGTARR